jgi:imidazolonepropionase-like amidohydrolase
LRDAIRRGEVAGPRILAAGPGVGAPGGACDRVFGGEGRAAGTAEVLRRAREVLDGGADFLKLCAGGGVVAGRQDAAGIEYGEEEIRTAVEEAHRRGRKVAAHAQGPAAIANAVRAGVDSIEHGSELDDEAIALMKEHGTYLVPTDFLTEALDLTKLPAPIRSKAEAILPLAQASHARAIAAGVKIAYGTDSGVYPHGLNGHEFETLGHRGMKPLDAIRSATVNACDLIGVTDRGTIAPGKLADLIAVPGNPLTDVTMLQKVAFVMKGGAVVKGP